VESTVSQIMTTNMKDKIQTTTKKRELKLQHVLIIIAICCTKVLFRVTIPSRFIISHVTSPEIFPLDKLSQIKYFPHLIPPHRSTESIIESVANPFSDITLRQFLSNSQGFHLAMAPAFFGYYVYFGALTTFNENVLLPDEIKEGKVMLPIFNATANAIGDEDQEQAQESLLKSVAGTSAGAMAAALIARGLNPRESAEFVSSMTLTKFADPLGLGGMLKGNLFEEIMVNRLKKHKPDGENFMLEDSIIPVAFTGFDLLSMSEKILTEGCMGRAARASATFPVLFQPVLWTDSETKIEHDGDGYLARLKRRFIPDALLIDGGVTDRAGIHGLAALLPHVDNKRIVSLAVKGVGSQGPLGPSEMPIGLHTSEVVSISIENAPDCGPWAMSNGPRAVQAARDAIKAVLDLPMYKGEEDGHYVVRVDATAFIPA